MSLSFADQNAPRREPSVWLGLVLYLGYLTVFFTTWSVNGVDYMRIGESAQTTRLWYAYPTLLGCAFLVVAISFLGWWRLVLFDKSRSGPAWIWIFPVVMAAIIANNFLDMPSGKLTFELVLWSSLGAVGVGLGEEMITRGSMVVGLRSRSLSGVLCLRHSMSKRSIYANESKNRHGGQGGIAAHFA
jgi:hypothetical protein